MNLLYSNSNYKFGGGSVLFNGNSWIYSNNDTAFSPGSENFTIAGWIYFSSNPSGWAPVWGNWWTNQGGTSLDYYGGKPRIVYDTSGTTKVISGTRNLPLNTWAYIVLQGKNAGGTSDVTLYVNGVPNGTVSGVYNIRKAPSQTRFYFGRATTAAYYLQSGTYVDDFFMVKGGPAMYEGPFTPPTQEFGTPVVPPVAEFTATPTSGTVPLVVQFTDTSTGSPASWNWSFGDGTYSAMQNPSHSYLTYGTHSVNLTVLNSGGSNFLEKPAYIMGTGGSYSVFVEGVGDYHSTADNLTDTVPLASNFYSEINGASNADATWTGYAAHYNDSAGSKYWSVSELSAIKADHADFALFAGHGNKRMIAFGTANSQQQLSADDMEFGATKAKWVTFASCLVLNLSTYNDMKPVFKGLHILNGYDTEGFSYGSQGTQFAERMKGDNSYPVQKIRDAWMFTLMDTINVADKEKYYGAWMWAEPCGEDHLPGYGRFCHAPIRTGGEYDIRYYRFNVVYGLGGE